MNGTSKKNCLDEHYLVNESASCSYTNLVAVNPAFNQYFKSSISREGEKSFFNDKGKFCKPSKRLRTIQNSSKIKLDSRLSDALTSMVAKLKEKNSAKSKAIVYLKHQIKVLLGEMLKIVSCFNQESGGELAT